MRISLKPVLLKLAAIAALLAVLIPNMPVNCIRITDSDKVLAASPVFGGNSFTTEYIHSVQLTPVIDEYRILQGRIWSWEERVQSHNAGLPYDAPKRGRFVMDPPWMIIRGGGTGTDMIAYRVGTVDLGRNKWHLVPFEEIRAYELFPSKRVYIASAIETLRFAESTGFQKTSQNLIK